MQASPYASLAALVFTLALTVGPARAEAELVLVENVEPATAAARLQVPLLIADGRGYRLACRTQADEERVIRGLGVLVAPSRVLSPLDPAVVAAAPAEHPILCPRAPDYPIKAFVAADETGTHHFLQFPTAFGAATHDNRIFRPGCAGLMTSLGISPADAIPADPRPFFGSETPVIACVSGEPVEVAPPESFAQWCVNAGLSAEQASTVEAVLAFTPEGIAARGKPAACARAQSFLSGVGTLNLSAAGLSEVGPLAALPELTALALENNQIVEVGPLGQLRKLAFLDLSGNRIENLAPLSALSGLTELDLADNRIADLRPLSSHLALVRLTLAGNRVADGTPLAFLKALHVLDLSRNLLTDAGIEALSGLGLLERLDLSDNRIETTAVFRQFADTTAIKLDGNPVFADERLDFADACALHRADATPFGFTLRVMLARAETERCADAAAHFAADATLDLSGAMLADVRPVALLGHLEALDLSGNAITDIAPLLGMKTLVSLDLSDNRIAQVDGLDGLPKLRHLVIRGNPLDLSRFGPACLAHDEPGLLDPSAQAEIGVLMQLSGTQGCAQAQEALRRMTDIRLRGAGLTTVRYFDLFENARELDLTGNALTDARPLEALSKLLKLNLADNELTSFAALPQLGGIEELSVGRNPISTLRGVERFGRLRFLHIGKTGIGDVSALAGLPFLERAQLDGLDLQFGGFADYCLVYRLDSFSLGDSRALMFGLEPHLAAAGVLQTDCPAAERWAATIESLNLNNAEIKALDPLRFFAGLRELRLSRNQVADVRPLANLPGLQTLHLERNRIEAWPRTGFASLEMLVLDRNRIDDAGPLSEAVRLVSLSLVDNKLADARALQPLADLQHLDLRFNKIAQPEAVQGLSVPHLYLKGNPICAAATAAGLAEACRREPGA
ncbi:MAG TPA: leucine-rich repeat domain-containing protein [Mesorhizobium sp.]|jgi:Leucine-rich repeat (LRR) protein|nr:leucine-rich repeat domain-containing protein [Mesorhizobium sp.]